MPLENLREIYRRAEAEGWAIGQFNVENLEFVQAVAAACRAKHSPAIFAVSASSLRYMGMDYLTALVRTAAEEVEAPVVLHLDHGPDVETARRCVEAGFTSVMIDASARPFEENVRLTREVVDLARPLGVSVEGELGRIGGTEDDLEAEGGAPWTDPEEAEEFVRRTGVDALAVAVGTSHGAYKFHGEPHIELERIAEIHARVPAAIVLHGASGVDPATVKRIAKHGGDFSGARGVTDEIYREAVRRGVRKVNIATDLRLAFIASLRESFDADPGLLDPRKLLGAARGEMRNLVEHKMEVLGSAGRY